MIDRNEANSIINIMENLKSIRIKRLKIENYKAIDHLELEFPEPMPGDNFDVFVMGSKNGVGKTSVLECISLLLLSGISDIDRAIRRVSEKQDILISLIKSGAREAIIQSDFKVDNNIINTKIVIQKNRIVIKEKDLKKFNEIFITNKWMDEEIDAQEQRALAFLGYDHNPVIIPPSFVYFHSYRKIAEGNPDLSDIMRKHRISRRYRESTISIFKQEILRLLMGKGGLFEGIEEKNSEKSLDLLNNLIEEYAGGRIAKLKPAYDNTFDFRIMPKNGGDSFSFDGLSSGQKEIISTLYLIWKNAQQGNGIVLIDEPELHLNAGWHRSFINKLKKMFPGNQFILATHSDTIFSSVDKDRRILLEEGE